MVGVGKSAASGVLIKNVAALERLPAGDTLVVDKAGTLMEGKPALVEVVAEGISESDRLRHVSALGRSRNSRLRAPSWRTRRNVAPNRPTCLNSNALREKHQGPSRWPPETVR